MRILFFLTLAVLSAPFILLSSLMVLGVWETQDPFTYFESRAFLESFKQSLQLSCTVALISMGIGLGLAYGFYTIMKRGYKRVYFFTLLLLFVIQPVILLSVFNQVEAFTQMNAFWQSVLIGVLHLAPLASLLWIYFFTLLNMNALYVSGQIASRWNSWRYILFPQLKIRIGVLFLLLFILSFIDQEVPSILGYRTYTEDLLAQMTLMENLEHIVLAAFPSFVLVAIAVWGFIYFTNDMYYQIYFQKQGMNQTNQYIGNSMIFLILAYLFWMIYMLSTTLADISLKGLLKENSDVIIQSIVLALLTASLSLGIVLSLKVGLKQYTSGIVALIVIGLLFFYILVPHALVSLALLEIYQWIGYLGDSGDYLIFIFGYLFILMPITMVLLYLLQKHEREDHFLTFFSIAFYDRWTKIILPKYSIQWTIVLFVTALFALNELSVSILLIPPGFETMVVRIYNLLHYGDKATVAFLSLVQLLFVMLLFIFLGWLSKRVSR